jgi:hypothetical protein
VAVKGLLVAIQLSNSFEIKLRCENEKDLERFKNVFPGMIAAAVKAGSRLQISDKDEENLNEFAADEIEKAGPDIDYLYIKESMSLFRMIAKTRKVRIRWSEP